MKFTKMHGCGNDYVYVNCLKETVDHPEEVAKRSVTAISASALTDLF